MLIRPFIGEFRTRDGVNFIDLRNISYAKTVTIIFSFFGVLIGLMIPLFPWWFVIAFIIFPILLVGVFKYPFLGLLLSILIVFNAIPLWMFPEIPAPGGRLKVSDVLLILVALAVFFDNFVKANVSHINLGRVLWPLCILLVFLVVSTVYGKLIRGNESAISEARNHMSWLILPTLAIVVNTIGRLKMLIRTLLLVGILVAIYVIIQSAFQVQIMGGRVESLDMRQNQDIVRSTAGGGAYIVAFSLYYLINAAAAKKTSWWFVIPACLILCAGLGATFGRGIWVATAFGFLVSSAFHRGFRGLLLAMIIGGVFVGGLLALTSIARPRMAEAIMARATGIGDEIDSGGSFNHRRVENQEAIKMILQRPLLGVGMGGEYKQIMSSVGAFEIETRYIHNSFLYFPLKMGIFACVIPFMFVLAFVNEALCKGWYRKLGYDGKCLPAATVGAFVVPLITSYTQPEWASSQGIVAISLLFSILFLYRGLNDSSKSE